VELKGNGELTAKKSETGRTSYLGISFKERSEAFDFVSALKEWDEKREKSSSVEEDSLQSLEFKDLSLKGEKITLKIKSRVCEKDEAETATSTTIAKVSEGNSSTLAPPPSSGRRRGVKKEE
jgi:hypothetical protein